MLRYLPFLIVAGFFLEIASIIWVGRALGVILTLLLIVAGVAAGISLFRKTGLSVAEALKSPAEDRTRRRQLMGTTAFGTLAGLLFMVPGFFSDVTALLLLLPPVQAWLAARVKFAPQPANDFHGHQPERFETIIEAEAVEVQGEVLPPEQPRR